MTWLATVLTIFPEMLPGPLAYSLAGRALEAGIWQLETVDIRDFARDKHRSVDDAPFGGGPGMVLRPDVLDAAIVGAGGGGPLLLLSPPRPPLGPQLWQGRRVREVLVPGDHQRVRAWRRDEAERLTRERRPDLWRRYVARQEAARQKDER